MAKESTRERIVDAADTLFYEQGYEKTSFSNIAEAVGITRGNFYYHFKTKDEILDAVIASRLAKTAQMLAGWESGSARPQDRIRSFIHILIANQARIMDHGCPVGTLSQELAKLEHPAKEEANRLFSLFRAWLKQQFALLGAGKESDAHALHVLAFSQGVATLANAFRDKRIIAQEVKRMDAWLDAQFPISTT